MYRARVVIQVLVLILVPLLPFCYALPGLGASQAPSIPESASKPPTPTDSPPPYDLPPPYDEPSHDSLPGYSRQGNSSVPSVIIYHYIKFPDYPAGSDFVSFERDRGLKNSPKEQRKLEQLDQVRKEVRKRLATYIQGADDKESTTEEFRAQFGYVSKYRVHFNKDQEWYPSYDLKPGDEAHVKMVSLVFDETHGRRLREEKWLVTLQRMSGSKKQEGQVLGAQVKDVEGATYPKVPLPQSKLKKILNKIFKKPGSHSN
ncbi:hypothetical protein FB446DRAFT_776329 [Lentinula raphanica]|nr:hypothetical protein FB446DRAFT_776329 [Lentinula raphanica]